MRVARGITPATGSEELMRTLVHGFFAGFGRRFMAAAVAALWLTAAVTPPAGASSEPGAEEEEGFDDSGFALDSSPYLSMDPFQVPIFQDNKMRGQLNVVMSLEIAEGESKLEIWKQTAKLRDGYLNSLNYYASNQLNYRKRVNFGLIKRKLQQVTDRLLGQDIAEVVLGQAHVQRTTKRKRRRR